MLSKRVIVMKLLCDDGMLFVEDGNVYLNGNKLHLCIDSDGYYIITYKRNNIPVHKIVAYMKFGDSAIEKGIVTRHINGNRLDNSFENIEIGTVRDNWYDIPKHIRSNIGKKRSLSMPALRRSELATLRNLKRYGKITKEEYDERSKC